MFKMFTLVRLSDFLIYKHVAKLTQFLTLFILSQLIIYLIISYVKKISFLL